MINESGEITVKRLIQVLMLASAWCVFGLSAQADTTSTTNVQTSFYAGPATGTSHYAGNAQIPAGQQPTRVPVTGATGDDYQDSASGRQTITTTTARPTTLKGWLAQATDAGRLPQTSEQRAWLFGLLGGLLLIAAILGRLIWREVRSKKRGWLV